MTTIDGSGVRYAHTHYGNAHAVGHGGRTGARVHFGNDGSSANPADESSPADTVDISGKTNDGFTVGYNRHGRWAFRSPAAEAVTETVGRAEESVASVNAEASETAANVFGAEADEPAATAAAAAEATEEMAAAEVQPGMDTRESRDALGKQYDEILADLRSKYDEPEAMSRFNDIMRADGWEVQEKISDRTMTRLQTVAGTPFSGMLMANALGQLGVVKSLKDIGIDISSFRPSELNTGNLQYSSSLQVRYGDDGDKIIEAGSWASYSSYNKDNYTDVMKSWNSRNVEQLNAEADFDVGEYVKGFGNFSASAVNTDLGTIISNVIKDAGLTLADNQSASLSLYKDENGNDRLGSTWLNMSEEDEKKFMDALDRATAKDPGIVAAFVKQSASVPEADYAALAGQFNNGTQSQTFSSGGRQFVYSAKEPSAVVMGDRLNVKTTSYVYQKKVSDTLDLGADHVSMNATIPFKPNADGSMTVNIDDRRAKLADLTAAMTKYVTDIVRA